MNKSPDRYAYVGFSGGTGEATILFPYLRFFMDRLLTLLHFLCKIADLLWPWRDVPGDLADGGRLQPARLSSAYKKG